MIDQEAARKLAEALRSDQWLIIERHLSEAINQHLQNCGRVTEDHRYWQGAYQGLVNWRNDLEKLAAINANPPFASSTKIY